MRQVNVIIKCSDETYDLIVTPFKKSKRLSPLVSKLLEGYLNDKYIRSYGDDLIDEYNKNAMEELNASIGSMIDSLSNIDMYSDELESISSMGMEKMNKVAHEEDEEAPKAAEEKPKEESDARFDKVNERLDNMESNIEKMVSMMSQIMSNGVSQHLNNIKVVKEETSMAEEEDPFDHFDEDEVEEKPEEDTDEIVMAVDKDVADNYMNKFLSSDMFSF